MSEKTEIEIQKEIIDGLRLSGWLVFRMNAGRRGGVNLAPKGTPDLLAMKKGKVLFVEVKKPGKKPTQVQEYFHRLLRYNSFTVVVATKLEDVPL